ncbi:MAG: anaerobic ribonucleoside-triphosphate reductase activating protein [Eubacterium sp.]|nr:anaerobic ribonucleoside-triphosphate reductase activating protein [Eubacterium sp.]
MNIRIAGTVPESIVDGPGIRYTIFTQGCPHHCEGCHNPETHDFNGGRLAETDKIYEHIVKDPLLRGVTYSGGDPFCQPAPLYDLGKKLKENTKLDIMIYTGYTFEQLLKMAESDSDVKGLLSVADIIVDGKFILSQRSLELKFKGSSNQRIIDVPASLKTGKVVLKEL